MNVNWSAGKRGNWQNILSSGLINFLLCCNEILHVIEFYGLFSDLPKLQSNEKLYRNCKAFAIKMLINIPVGFNRSMKQVTAFSSWSIWFVNLYVLYKQSVKCDNTE